MGDTTGISWTDATVNFWWGCTKVGPGCDHCYAETWSKRTGGNLWGVGAERRKIKGAAALMMKMDLGYARWQAEHGRRRRVFIQSMSDLFDNEVSLDWFEEAWGHIEVCDRLEIQIVTKRISIVEKRLAAIRRTAWPKHVGLMVTVCNQEEADRDIPRLLQAKATLGIPWVGVSIEPLLGPIDINEVIPNPLSWSPSHGFNGLDWVIVGGESGPGARPMHPDWARAIRDQCAAAGVPFHFKQHGEWIGVPDLRNLQGGSGPGFGAFDHCKYDMDAEAVRVGKARSGRLLDGVEHNGFPEI